jgi:hypothetical protein
VGLRAGDVGDVLDQGAAQQDVEQLHPPADGQQRQVPAQRGLEQRDLGGVPLRPGGGRVRSGLLAVPRRVDVGPAGEHQAVQPADHVGADGAGRQQDRLAAGLGDGVRVGGGQQHGRHVPEPPPGLLAVGGDADQGAHPVSQLRCTSSVCTSGTPGR